MRVLVTGSSGFLGRAVLVAMHAAGCEVVAATRRPERLQQDNLATIVTMDVTDRSNVCAVFAESRCHAIVHLAGVTRMRESTSQPLAFYDVNSAGTLNALHAVDELTRREGRPIHFVFTSTGAVYGSHPAVPQVEDQPTSAENPYAASKYFAEEMIRHHTQSGMSVATILRCSNIAGGVGTIHDEDGDHIIPNVLAAIAGGTPVRLNGDGESTRDYVHVADVAEAIRLAVLSPPAQGYELLNIGSGTETPVRAIIRAAERAVGRPAIVERRPPGAEARRVVMSNHRATERLGWLPTLSAVDRLVADAWTAVQLSAAEHRAA